MTFKEFFHKLTSRYLWGNLIAMALVLVALVLGLFLFLNAYTHHGETVVVPDCVVNAAKSPSIACVSWDYVRRLPTPVTMRCFRLTRFSTKTSHPADASSLTVYCSSPSILQNRDQLSYRILQTTARSAKRA